MFKELFCAMCQRRTSPKDAGSNPSTFTFVLFVFSILAHVDSTCKGRSDSQCCANKVPIQCTPSFENIAMNKVVEVSETCGIPRHEKFCHLAESPAGFTRVCDVCKRIGRKSHPARFLTDINDTGRLTYWQSKTVGVGSRRDITLTVSFGKQFELAYISMEFFSRLPRALIIYKKMNHAARWEPYQYYAEDCSSYFGMQSKEFANGTNEREVLCKNFENQDEVRGGSVVFNPTLGRPSGHDVEESFIMQDWVTATDVRFVLDPAEISRHSLRSGRAVGTLNVANKRHEAFTMNHALNTPVTKGAVITPSTGPTNELQFKHYAINDISIGGTCKCNGHASSCSLKKGKLACDCRHNTDGVNCEKCKAFYHQRPWKRASRSSANECVACECHLHSKKCRFDAELYEKTGNGGVCLKCRHHTYGRFCHMCKPGYHRNNNTSIASPTACKPCGCHPVGAAGKICHPVSGQCPCKDGVTGKRCNRCAKGYEQTKSPIAPCVRTTPSGNPPTPAPIECRQSCRTKSASINIKKFCKSDFAVHVKVKAVADEGKRKRITLQVIKPYRRAMPRLVRRKLYHVLVKPRIAACKCLKKNGKFLLVGNYESSGRTKQKANLVIGKRTIVLPWRRKYRRQLIKLAQKASKREIC
uniref:NET1a netrin n=1 Tax=Phallusia mammillata TaxID=59560 RepID=A0A6F9DMQ6_9ASCI|nr:NET1a netrin precursor [Phallusia mammillata]